MPIPCRRVAATAMMAALCVLAGCAQPPAGFEPAGPIPPGQARLWFYRDYQPSVSFNVANVDLNGTRIVSVPAYGPAIYRDVPPGQYHVMAESFVVYDQQGTNVTVGPGQQLYLKIENSPINWGDLSVYQRDVFYVRAVPPEVARAQLAATPQ